MSSNLENLKKELKLKNKNIKIISKKNVTDYINNNKENDEIYLGYLKLKNDGVLVLKGPRGPAGLKGKDAICPNRNYSDIDERANNLFSEIDNTQSLQQPTDLDSAPTLERNPVPGFGSNSRIEDTEQKRKLMDSFGRNKYFGMFGGKKTKKSKKVKKVKKSKKVKKVKKVKKSKKVKKIKGGGISLVPKNPTPSSYYPAPTNSLPHPPCRLPHFRPYLLNQKGI
tara:strand:+ start:137 stop:811 length:675 start_codon:yes stop_codon:yes gene_type:complete